MTHFRRVLSYVWPQKRYLVPLAFVVVGVATTYSVSIGSILPTLTVIVRPEGLHGWLDHRIAQSRLHATLVASDACRDVDAAGPTDSVPAVPALVADMDADSPLLAATPPVRRGDLILGVDGKRGGLFDVCDVVAGVPTETPVTLTVRGPNDAPGVERTVTVEPRRRSTHWNIARTLAGWLPRGLEAGDRLRTLVFVLSLLFVIVIVGNLCLLAAKYLTVLVCARAVMDVRRQMYAHVLTLPMHRFMQNTSDMMSRFVQDIQDVYRGLLNFFEEVVAEPLKALGVTAVALWIQPRVTLVVLVAAPVAALIFRQFGKKIRRASRKLLAAYGSMLGALESTLNGMRVVKGYTRETYERRRLFRIDRQLLAQQLKLGFIEALTSPVIELIGFIASASVVMWFAYQVVHQALSVEEFLTMLLCFAAIFQPVRKVTKVYPKIQRAAAAGQRLFETIDSPGEYAHDATAPRLAPIHESVEIRDVAFTYPGATRPALRGVNLTVRCGETMAIVGPNGSGKTTLVSLLPRFFEPTSGEILIDGQSIHTVRLRSLRGQISLITQETVIFSDTVTNNILYGRPKATMDEVVDAARRAFADEFIRQMPQGYDTIVGEHGATLSGGQRQRIAIARAILRDAPILIFDEATSQIDPESELKIQQAMEAFVRGRTAFVIAHRYSTISEADRIAVMDDGEIVAVGTHARLFESCTLYRRLCETQFRDAG